MPGLLEGNITDEALIQAREAHLFAYAEYAARQPFLAAAAPPGVPLYEPVIADDTLSNCCLNLLSIIGWRPRTQPTPSACGAHAPACGGPVPRPSG